MSYIVATMLWLCPYICFAQTFSGSCWGIGLGLHCALGNRINRIGVKLNAYAHWRHTIQINGQWCGFYAFEGYGLRAKRHEQQAGIGISGAWGNRWANNDTLPVLPFLSPTANQTQRPNSLSYAYLWYADKAGLSQQSGAVAVQIGNITLLCENDLFAGQGRDRYRTGAFGLYYTHLPYRFALVNILFSPDPKGTPRIRDDQHYPARYGYFDIGQAAFCANCSHGILALQTEYALPYGQIIATRWGIDSEQVRHVVQNKLIHDLPFIPKSLNRARNPHVPMLDSEGKAYLFRPNQQLKRPSLWWTFALLPPDFY